MFRCASVSVTITSKMGVEVILKGLSDFLVFFIIYHIKSVLSVWTLMVLNVFLFRFYINIQR
jgi:hypothetical protein